MASAVQRREQNGKDKISGTIEAFSDINESDKTEQAPSFKSRSASEQIEGKKRNIPKKLSFKEALCQENLNHNSRKPEVQTLASNKELIILEKTIVQEMAELIPSLKFSNQIPTYWKQALIIKSTGKSFEATYFRNRFFSLWKLKKNPKIAHLGLGFYMVHNLLGEDRVKNLTSRWKVGQDPLLVRLWQPNFKPGKETPEKITTIWNKLPMLPIKYHSPQTLIAIGNLIGRTVALDASKVNTFQATATRICIEADI